VTGLIVALLLPAGAKAAVSRVSVTRDGAQAADHSFSPVISADGRYIAFQSAAQNLAPGVPLSGSAAFFVRDRLTGAVEDVSAPQTNLPGYGYSFGRAAISGDGRFVAFDWNADNVVPGDTNKARDVFVRDRLAGRTERVSVATGGAQADGDSSGVSISADGRFATFSSSASNLVAGDTPGSSDLFLRDRQEGTTTRLASFVEGGAISADGRSVVVSAGTLTYVLELATGKQDPVCVSTAGAPSTQPCTGAVISADGRYVAFTSAVSNLVLGDTNGVSDLFVRDRLARTTERVDISSSGAQITSIYCCAGYGLSADGRFVTFASGDPSLVASDSNGAYDVFVRDRLAGTTERVSLPRAGGQGNGESSAPTISPDGRFVAFETRASNLVPGDTNGTIDVFVADRAEPASFPAPTAYCGAVRGALTARRAGLSSPQARLWLDRSLQSLDIALEPQRWANGGLALNSDGLGALNVLRTAALRLKYANAALRDATARDRIDLVAAIGALARVRFQDAWAAAQRSWPRPDFLLWRAERHLDLGDGDNDRVRATLNYIHAWEMLLGQPPT
jgi:Tol biopolymer transport system component